MKEMMQTNGKLFDAPKHLIPEPVLVILHSPLIRPRSRKGYRRMVWAQRSHWPVIW
jgi:hypothetical protein